MSLFSRSFALCKNRLSTRCMSTCHRPKIELDKDVEQKLSDSSFKMKARKHPGTFNCGVISLPVQLQEAIARVINDKSEKDLLKRAEMLNNHLIFKKPPLTAEQERKIRDEIRQKIAASDLVKDLKPTSEDEKVFLDSVQRKSTIAYNQKAYKWKAVNYDNTNSIVYMLARVAQDYASLVKVFQEIKKRQPGFKPQSLFDFGSGVGSVIWAAKSSWKTHIKEIFCVDSSVDMSNLSLSLLQRGIKTVDDGPVDPMATAEAAGLYFRQYMPSSATVKYDLVVCAHSLLELPSAELRLQTVHSLWKKSQGYLVLVEHGSRAAYEVIIEARDFLLSLAETQNDPSLRGHVFSPCPHDSDCPQVASLIPCNFEVSYQPLSIGTKAAVAKERFSYLVLKKGYRPADDPQWPRVVQPVLRPSRHTICRVCSGRGKLEEIVVTRGKHDLLTNHCVRSTFWGDLLPVTISGEDKTEEQGLFADQPGSTDDEDSKPVHSP